MALSSGGEAIVSGLVAHGVDTVIVTGLMTQYCCVTTARHAHDLDYKVIFVSNANTGPDMPDLGFGAVPHTRMLEAIAILRGVPPPTSAAHAAEVRGSTQIETFIVQAPTIDRALLESLAPGVQIVPHDRGEAVASADVALSSSGTATLECAVLGTPVVVMYRLSPMTYRLAKWLVRLPYFSLVNIVAGKQVVPELLQSDVTGRNIAAAMRNVLADRERVREELRAVRSKLGEPGASRRAAEAIMSVARA